MFESTINIKRLLLLIAFLAGTLNLSGCVIIGVGVSTGTTHMEITNPPVDIPDIVKYEYLKGDKIEYAAEPQITSFDVINQWGTPKEYTCLPDGKEIWSYQDEDAVWSGLVIGAIVPIPLMLPTGHESVDFHIANGYVTKADVQLQSSGFACFFVATMSAGDGSWHFDESSCGVGGRYMSWMNWKCGTCDSDHASNTDLPSFCK